MCIVCNCNYIGSDFVDTFVLSQHKMHLAADLMLACSRHPDATPEQRKQYNRTHKQMVRLIKEWNKLEHTREIHKPASDPRGIEKTGASN